MRGSFWDKPPKLKGKAKKKAKKMEKKLDCPLDIKREFRVCLRTFLLLSISEEQRRQFAVTAVTSLNIKVVGRPTHYSTKGNAMFWQWLTAAERKP